MSMEDLYWDLRDLGFVGEKSHTSGLFQTSTSLWSLASPRWLSPSFPIMAGDGPAANITAAACFNLLVKTFYSNLHIRREYHWPHFSTGIPSVLFLQQLKVCTGNHILNHGIHSDRFLLLLGTHLPNLLEACALSRKIRSIHTKTCVYTLRGVFGFKC